MNGGNEATPLLLQWHYLIFWLPAGMAALLLLLTAFRPSHSHHGGMRSAGGAGGGHHGGGGGMRHHAAGSSGGGRGARHSHTTKSGGARRDSGVTPLGIVLSLIGARNAPLPLVLEMYVLFWGSAGYWANRMLLPDGTVAPPLWRVVPSLVIAFAFSLICGRMSAALMERFLPRDQTFVVSRDSLFGLTGRVVFAVSESAGRVHVYDEFGTLHDESCRVAPGMRSLSKGETARIVDRDAKGFLIVEGAPEPIPAA